jgi:hypothetical protein
MIAAAGIQYRSVRCRVSFGSENKHERKGRESCDDSFDRSTFFYLPKSNYEYLFLAIERERGLPVYL